MESPCPCLFPNFDAQDLVKQLYDELKTVDYNTVPNTVAWFIVLMKLWADGIAITSVVSSNANGTSSYSISPEFMDALIHEVPVCSCYNAIEMIYPNAVHTVLGNYFVKMVIETSIEYVQIYKYCYVKALFAEVQKVGNYIQYH